MYATSWLCWLICLLPHSVLLSLYLVWVPGSSPGTLLPRPPCPLAGWWIQSTRGTSWTISSVQSLSRVWLFATPWIAARQASLSITNSRSSPKLMSIESVMPSSHLIVCHPLLLPRIPPSIRVFSNESALCMRWPKYWSFSINISPSNEHLGLISFRMDWLDLLVVQRTLKSLLHGCTCGGFMSMYGKINTVL